MHIHNIRNTAFAVEPMARATVLALSEAVEHPFETAVAEHDQYRYIINLDERGEFSASLYRILPNGQDGEAILEIDSEAASFLAEEGVDLNDPRSVVGYQMDVGFLPTPASALGASEDVLMVDPLDYPVWEFMSVHVIDAIRLREIGEVIIDHPGGGSDQRGHLIWCRDCRLQKVAA